MKSKAIPDFWKFFHKLPKQIQIQADTTYQLWRVDPYHHSLHFKQLGKKDQVYSVRIGLKWRAMGAIRKNTIYWFWIGSHEAYNQLIRQFK